MKVHVPHRISIVYLKIPDPDIVLFWTFVGAIHELPLQGIRISEELP